MPLTVTCSCWRWNKRVDITYARNPEWLSDWLIQCNELNNNISEIFCLSQVFVTMRQTVSQCQLVTVNDIGWPVRPWSTSYTWHNSTSSICTHSGSAPRPGGLCSLDHNTSTGNCLTETHRQSDILCTRVPIHAAQHADSATRHHTNIVVTCNKLISKKM